MTEHNSPAGRSERRIVTALFADVTGSTGMAEGLDPEDWTEIMNEAFASMITAVEKYGGSVTRLMGDGMLALFGAPTAHEDDPERAVLAGLGMLEAIQPLRGRLNQETELGFDIRVGLNTGLAVVGQVGIGSAAEYTAMGDAINLAARMEQTTVPGTLQVTQATYRHVADAVEAESMGLIEVKGKSEPIAAYRINAHVPRATSIAADSFLGRDHDLEALLQMLRNVEAGVGGIAFVIGEAGLGKTRLLAELRRAADADDDLPAAWLHSHGASYNAAQPYGLMMQRVQQLYGLRPGDDLADVDRAVAIVHGDMPAELRAATIESIHAGLTARHHGTEDQLQGDALKQQIKLAILQGTALMAERAGAVVMVFDDLQWTDAASREILETTLSLVEDHAVLVVGAMRPDHRSNGWQLRQRVEVEFPHRYREIRLGPLPEEAGRRLLIDRLGASDVPSTVVESAVAAAEGNPLFVEEIAIALAERGAITSQNSAQRTWNPEYDGEAAPLPQSLHALLVARIDSLPPHARSTLHAAAVIGTSFSRSDVAALLPDADTGTDDALAVLVRTSFVRETSRVPEPRFAFLQELARHAAYESMLRKDRRRLHSVTARHLREVEATPPSVLARHLEAAGEQDAARTAWIEAGHHAKRLSAMEDARTYFAAASALIDDNTTDPSEVIAISEQWGRALELCNRHAEALRVYERLEAASAERNDPTMRLAALTAIAVVRATFNDVHDSSAGATAAAAAVRLAGEVGDRRRLARAHWARMLIALYGTRDFAAALADGTAALRMGDGASSEEELAYIRHDLSRAYLFGGLPAEANATIREVLIAWRRLGNLPMLADALSMQADIAHDAGRLGDAERAAHEGLAIAEQIESGWLIAVLTNNLIVVDFERGRFGDAITRLDSIRHLGDAVGMMEDTWHLEWALAHAAAGDHAEARATIARLRETRPETDLLDGTEVATQLLSGDVEAALRLARGARGNVVAVGLDLMVATAPVEAEARAGDPSVALELAAEIEADHAASGRTPHLLNVALAAGIALRRQGRLDEARDRLATAATEAEAHSIERIGWKLAAELAITEEEAGRPDAAAAHWQHAYDLVQILADHFESGSLRAHFLAQPAVREVSEHR